MILIVVFGGAIWGWMLFENPADEMAKNYVKDIENDSFYLFCQKFMIPIQVALGLTLFFWAAGLS